MSEQLSQSFDELGDMWANALQQNAICLGDSIRRSGVRPNRTAKENRHVWGMVEADADSTLRLWAERPMDLQTSELHETARATAACLHVMFSLVVYETAPEVSLLEAAGIQVDDLTKEVKDRMSQVDHVPQAILAPRLDTVETADDLVVISGRAWRAAWYDITDPPVNDLMAALDKARVELPAV